MLEVRKGFVFLTDGRGMRKAIRIDNITEVEERNCDRKSKREVMVNGSMYQDATFDDVIEAICGKTPEPKKPIPVPKV